MIASNENHLSPSATADRRKVLESLNNDVAMSKKYHIFIKPLSLVIWLVSF